MWWWRKGGLLLFAEEGEGGREQNQGVSLQPPSLHLYIEEQTQDLLFRALRSLLQPRRGQVFAKLSRIQKSFLAAPSKTPSFSDLRNSRSSFPSEKRKPDAYSSSEIHFRHLCMGMVVQFPFLVNLVPAFSLSLSLATFCYWLAEKKYALRLPAPPHCPLSSSSSFLF